ncbi:hypothetical protein AAC978_01320 [Desulfitobacterium sp. THU1]|uniref:hypothetical protein n=1 Tax=Desulfitobacterium sp. THU1 TaxID=3138072 RepID=UPI0031204897
MRVSRKSQTMNQGTCPRYSLERIPKDFDIRKRATSKRAATRSSRKACSGVGLETGRFQLAMRQEPI